MQLTRPSMVLLLALAGCAKNSNSGSIERAPNCPAGRCPEADIAILGVEIFATSLGAQEFRSIPFDSLSGTFQLETATLVRLSGSLKLPSELQALDLKNAAIVATRPSRLSGRPPVSYQGFLNPTTGKYQLDLPPNLPDESYTVQVAIDDEILPPFSIDVSVSRDTVLDLVPTAPSSNPAIDGMITSALGTPLVGIEVLGRDPTTHDIVTTRNRTDAAGHFEIRQSSQSASDGLIVEARINDTLRLERLISTVQSASNQGELVLALPALPNPVPQSFGLAGLSSSGVELPEIGARVTATVRIVDKANNDVEAVHELTADSDSDGRVMLNLYPSEGGQRQYTLAIATLGSSDFQSMHTIVDAGPVAGFSSTLMLLVRPKIFGVVLDAQGEPVRDATVEPRLTSYFSGDASDNLAALLQPTTTTDLDGRFTIRVDPGQYDLVITPHVQDLLPRLWLTSEVVDGTTDLGTIHLPTAARLVGRLVDLQQKPLPNVTVRIFELPSENALCDAVDIACQHPARLQAELTSRQDGTVEALLPPKTP